MSETSLKKAAAGADLGEIVIVRNLIKAGTTGVVAEGVLEKTAPNSFNAANTDYFIRGTNNTLYILNESAAIKEQLGGTDLLGKKVRVEYNGKVTTKKGKSYHDYECFLVD